MSAEPEPSAPTKEQEEELLPALFWDGSEDWINEDNCADFAALQSLKYDDSTPEERAEELKRKGNDALKYKLSFALRHAQKNSLDEECALPGVLDVPL